MEVGEDDEPPITIRIHNGVLIVENEADDAARFIDPVEAVDHILTLYDGRIRLDEDIFIEADEVTEQGI